MPITFQTNSVLTVKLQNVGFIMTKKCLICESEFKPKNSNQKYCSPKCADIAQKRQSRKYYLDNREEKILKSKEWCRNNKDKCRSYYKKYRQKNKEKYSEYMKKYRIEHREELREYKKKYHLNRQKALNDCMIAHDYCYACPEEEGYCPYD